MATPALVARTHLQLGYGSTSLPSTAAGVARVRGLLVPQPARWGGSRLHGTQPGVEGRHLGRAVDYHEVVHGTQAVRCSLVLAPLWVQQWGSWGSITGSEWLQKMNLQSPRHRLPLHLLYLSTVLLARCDKGSVVRVLSSAACNAWDKDRQRRGYAINRTAQQDIVQPCVATGSRLTRVLARDAKGSC